MKVKFKKMLKSGEILGKVLQENDYQSFRYASYKRQNMWQNVMNFVSKTSNKGSPQIKTSKLIKVAHQIRKQPWEKIPKLIIVGATTI